ncbi:MAG: dTMP kinase, partial [Nitrosotalea sp.]
NLVYGTVNGLDLKWLENLDQGLPKENIVILLDVKVSDSFSRKTQKRDRFEKDKTFALKIANTYRKLAKRYRWNIVNASQEKAIVHQQIRNIVSKHIR